ncbi:unnamed protein product [Mytilus coruscus]|uniref:Uncharacterized protein n=1 Tax=Mytilus coruscus TaxID=42192 RepID=A0A6J8B8D0_MYTCO|nr:unnamed protein product [Mytilus coruscus]
MEETVNNSRSVLSLEVTQEQREAIYHFFAHNDWEFKDISGENASVEENESNEGDFFIAQDENSEECPNCLCRPCITNERNRQLWWENENHPEHQRNAYLRKDKYKRFWTNLLHRGVWKDPRYLLRKREALRRDPRRHKCVYHRRDLMPKCVLELVRQWFPNLPEQQYMGHMWE